MTDKLEINFTAVQKDDSDEVISDTLIRINYPKISNESANAINLGITKSMTESTISVISGMADAKSKL